MTKYFENISTLEELETKYRELAKKYHPDTGGTKTEFQELNEEYKNLRIAIQYAPALQMQNSSPEKPRKKRKVKITQTRKEKITEAVGTVFKNAAEQLTENLMEIFTK